MTCDQRAAIVNRYWNAADFLDNQVADLVESLDPANQPGHRHRRSWRVDLRRRHADPWQQTFGNPDPRATGMIAGSPIAKPGGPTQPTSHVDILPTILHILNGRAVSLGDAHGRHALEPAHELAPSCSCKDFSMGTAPTIGTACCSLTAPGHLVVVPTQPVGRPLSRICRSRARMLFDQVPSDEQFSRLASGVIEQLRNVAE